MCRIAESVEIRLAALEGAPAGDHLVKNRAEGKNIGAAIDLPALGLLGRHVGHGADDGAFFCLRVFLTAMVAVADSGSTLEFFGQLGQAEVEQFHAAVVGDDDVGRLQIAVNDSGCVGARQGVGNLNCILQCVFEGAVQFLPINWSSVLPGTNSMAMKSVPSEQMLTIVNVDDVGMIQGGSRFGLLHKAALAVGAGSGIGAQDFDRDGAVEMGIESAIHDAHAALAELGIDPVMA